MNKPYSGRRPGLAAVAATSWKTSLGGVLAGVALLLPELADALVAVGVLAGPVAGGDGVFDMNTAVAAAGMIFGFAAARDGDASSQDHGVRR
ncbi:MAG: hypothetical protein AAGF47_03740 [Planctomycetota bacterium]